MRSSVPSTPTMSPTPKRANSAVTSPHTRLGSGRPVLRSICSALSLASGLGVGYGPWECWRTPTGRLGALDRPPPPLSGADRDERASLLLLRTMGRTEAATVVRPPALRERARGRGSSTSATRTAIGKQGAKLLPAPLLGVVRPAEPESFRLAAATLEAANHARRRLPAS